MILCFWSKKSGGGRQLGDDLCTIVKHQIHVPHIVKPHTSQMILDHYLTNYTFKFQLVLPRIGALLDHVNRAFLAPYKVIGSKDQNTGSAVPFLWLVSHLYSCSQCPSRLWSAAGHSEGALHGAWAFTNGLLEFCRGPGSQVLGASMSQRDVQIVLHILWLTLYPDTLQHGPAAALVLYDSLIAHGG